MKDEVRLTLETAIECLEDAAVLLSKKRYKASVSRSYYAIFNAAKSALLSIDVEVFTHQGVNVQFGKHFIKTGIFDRSLIRLFSKLLDTRQKADYEIGFRASEEESKDAYKEASRFVGVVKEYLEK
jgi:uncharacterized protein (UPF0332 family)